MEGSLAVLAELTHFPQLLSPPCLWIHNMNWRQETCSGIARRPPILLKSLIKRGFHEPAAIGDTFLLFCFLGWAGARKAGAFQPFFAQKNLPFNTVFQNWIMLNAWIFKLWGWVKGVWWTIKLGLTSILVQLTLSISFLISLGCTPGVVHVTQEVTCWQKPHQLCFTS